MDIIRHNNIEAKIIVLRNTTVILDSDVAELYGVETRRINEAVSNNPDKFPEKYMFEVDKQEFEDLRSKFSTAKLSKTRVLPKAFTERGLYMLATILKGEKARETTFEIIETFARIRELSRVVGQMVQEPDKIKQKSLMKRSGELIGDIFKNDLEVTDSEASIELNLAMLKIKHITKRSKKANHNTDTQELDELKDEIKELRKVITELTQSNTIKSLSENSNLINLSKKGTLKTL